MCHNDCKCHECEDERKDAARYRFLRTMNERRAAPFIGLRDRTSRFYGEHADALVDSHMDDGYEAAG